jgi:hypothetical protein
MPEDSTTSEVAAKELVTLFKRKGTFDELRRSLYKDFNDSVGTILQY